MKETIHVFKNQGDAFIYVPKYKAFAKVSEDLAALCESKPWRVIDLLVKKRGEVAPKVSTQKKPATVYLNISASCNLQCVYCYANRGKYTEAEKPMTLETVRNTLTWFETLGIPLGRFTFFGGEPLLRFPFIKESVELIETYYERRKEPLPGFSIITNGVFLDEEKSTYFAQKGFGVTVSLDGPKDLHDFLRPGPKGSRSFDTIMANLERLIHKGVVPSIEATFTQEHLRQGLTPKGLLEQFQNTLGIRVAVISPASGKEGDPWKVMGHEVAHLYAEATRYSLDSIEGPNPILMQNASMIMNKLLSQTQAPSYQYCYANLGEDHFAVSGAGQVYPCQMFNEQTEFCMGDVKVQDGQALAATQGRFKANSRELNQCKGCWAKEVCFICPGGVYHETNQLKKIPAHRCAVVKSMSEEVIAHLGRLKEKLPEEQKVFWENLQTTLE